MQGTLVVLGISWELFSARRWFGASSTSSESRYSHTILSESLNWRPCDPSCAEVEVGGRDDTQPSEPDKKFVEAGAQILDNTPLTARIRLGGFTGEWFSRLEKSTKNDIMRANVYYGLEF